MRPSIKSIVLCAALAVSSFGLLWYLEYSEYQNDKAYVDMCEIMGGKAVLGKRGTNQCLNVSSLLGAE